jgi:hypothetical protein
MSTPTSDHKLQLLTVLVLGVVLGSVIMFFVYVGGGRGGSARPGPRDLAPLQADLAPPPENPARRGGAPAGQPPARRAAAVSALAAATSPALQDLDPAGLGLWALPVAPPATRALEEPERRHGFVSGMVPNPKAWESYYIFLARPEAARSTDGQVVPGMATLVIETNYSAFPLPRELTVPTWSMLLSAQSRWDFGQDGPGGRLLIAMLNSSHLPRNAPPDDLRILCEPLDPARPTDADILESLRLVSASRQTTGADKEKARIAIVESRLVLAVEYLAKERGAEDSPLAPAERDRFVALRDDAGLPVYTRLLASAALHARDAGYRDAREHTRWVRGWLAEPHALSSWVWGNLLPNLGDPDDEEAGAEYAAAVWPLLRRLLEHPRTDDIEARALLGHLALAGGDQTIPLEARHQIATYLLEQCARQPSAQRTLWYLRAATGTIVGMGMRVQEPEDAAAFAKLLDGYERSLERLLATATDAQVRGQIQLTLRDIGLLVSRQPTTVPGRAPNGGRVPGPNPRENPE